MPRSAMWWPTASDRNRETASQKVRALPDNRLLNWDELSGIGIMKDELELSGEMDTLLRGEKTKVMSLSLVLLGVDVVMDATLQLVRKGESPLLEIQGVTPLGK